MFSKTGKDKESLQARQISYILVRLTNVNFHFQYILEQRACQMHSLFNFPQADGHFWFFIIVQVKMPAWERSKEATAKHNYLGFLRSPEILLQISECLPLSCCHWITCIPTSHLYSFSATLPRVLLNNSRYIFNHRRCQFAVHPPGNFCCGSLKGDRTAHLVAFSMI